MFYNNFTPKIGGVAHYLLTRFFIINSNIKYPIIFDKFVFSIVIKRAVFADGYLGLRLTITI